MLNSKYGDAPENLLLVIAGQETLNPNHWSEFGGFMSTIALEEFTELEAKTYLERKGITDPATVDVIIQLSGKIPVLLATLAEAAPNSPHAVTDPSATAVERFLKWIEDPIQRNLAHHAALPRKLNQDIVQWLLPEGADASILFQWLCKQPFVKKRKSGDWGYHDVVRDLMLRYQYQLSQDTWSGLHRRLAAFYEVRALDLGIESRELQFVNEEWCGFSLEILYHRLSAAYSKEQPKAVADFATKARLNGFENAIPWCETIYQSGKVQGNTEMGELLRTGVMAIISEEWAAALPLISKINSEYELLIVSDASFFNFQEGRIEYKNKNHQAAIQCYLKTIRLTPNHAAAWNNLGCSYVYIEQKEKAIECFENITKIYGNYALAWYNLGATYYALGQKERALECYQKAVEHKSDNHEAWYNMGIAYASLEQKEKAVECYEKAVEYKPDHDTAYNALGYLYFQLSKIEESIQSFEKAAEHGGPTDFNPRVNVAYLRLRLGKSEESKSLSESIWQDSGMKEPFSAKNLGHYFLLSKDSEKALEWYRVSLPLWEGAEENLFDHLETDYDNLLMSSHGISREAYDAIIAELKRGHL